MKAPKPQLRKPAPVAKPKTQAMGKVSTPTPKVRVVIQKVASRRYV